MSTRTRFEKEAKGNSEMAYSVLQFAMILHFWGTSCILFFTSYCYRTLTVDQFFDDNDVIL